jgi:anti-anti-sigma regulatory factor
MPISIETKQDKTVVVAASGELTIMEAPELKSRLLAALNLSARVQLDLSGALSLDLAALQVIAAARRAGTEVRDANGVYAAAAEKAGLKAAREG